MSPAAATPFCGQCGKPALSTACCSYHPPVQQLQLQPAEVLPASPAAQVAPEVLPATDAVEVDDADAMEMTESAYAVGMVVSTPADGEGVIVDVYRGGGIEAYFVEFAGGMQRLMQAEDLADDLELYEGPAAVQLPAPLPPAYDAATASYAAAAPQPAPPVIGAKRPRPADLVPPSQLVQPRPRFVPTPRSRP